MLSKVSVIRALFALGGVLLAILTVISVAFLTMRGEDEAWKIIIRYLWMSFAVYFTLSLVALLDFYDLAQALSEKFPRIAFKPLFSFGWIGLTLFLCLRMQWHLQKGWLYLFVLIAALSLAKHLTEISARTK